MAFIDWKPEFSVSHAEIDRQHPGLVRLLNDLHPVMLGGADAARMRPVFDGLVHYTESHFRAEEALMQEAAYPNLPAHRIEHQQFVAQLKQGCADLQAGRFTAPMKLLSTVKNWLFNHILGSDKQYAPYLAKLNSARRPAAVL
jgi:hemerythrin-like metal-binding protein